ncbi:MAG: hypothetical protein HC828_22325 [Blastochloris sp.]|nr:hypothetical protein [Blastochloris sp.]
MKDVSRDVERRVDTLRNKVEEVDWDKVRDRVEARDFGNIFPLPKKQRRGINPGTLAIVTLGGVVGGWLVYSALGINHKMPLPPAIEAKQERFRGPTTGFLNYYHDNSGTGRPLVLIHSINAAAVTL